MSCQYIAVHRHEARFGLLRILSSSSQVNNFYTSISNGRNREHPILPANFALPSLYGSLLIPRDRPKLSDWRNRLRQITTSTIKDVKDTGRDGHRKPDFHDNQKSPHLVVKPSEIRAKLDVPVIGHLSEPYNNDAFDTRKQELRDHYGDKLAYSKIELDDGSELRELRQNIDANQARSYMLQGLADQNATPTTRKALDGAKSSKRRPKLDLSYYNVRAREAILCSDGVGKVPFASATTFRKNAGLRRITSQYMHYIELCMRSGTHGHAQDRCLLRVFSETSVALLKFHKYDVEDVVAWSWVFQAEDIDASIHRFVALSRHRRAVAGSPLPLFLPLQLLRAQRMDASSLDLLLKEIASDVEHGNRWSKDSAAVLLIRLLRHARLVDASAFSRITELAPRIMPFTVSQHIHEDVKRLAHFYNRLLSLIALPIAIHPFISVEVQQRAQLKIVQLMMKSELGVPVNREGYRALARVQMMHKKTLEEQRWSNVKAPSWPPWRRDELGIDERLEYPGRASRVSKVLKRLLEAGYSPESVEQETQILSGWDTDKSPTIQVRRLMNRRPLAWIKRMVGKGETHHVEVDHSLWAARVAATRSVREAWVCFYSYMHRTMDQKRQLQVYYEMFFKLFARTQQSDPRSVPSPGDGREVFADPISSRDQVYVPTEPLSIEELYSQMLQDHIRPAGRLLAALIDSAHSIKQGLDYVSASSLGDVKKDVLLHPENYPKSFISSIYANIPDYLLASYIALLAKRFHHEEIHLRMPGSESIEERENPMPLPTRPLRCAFDLLRIWRPTYMPAYHALLEGLCTHAKKRNTSNSDVATKGHSFAELWQIAKNLVDILSDQRLPADISCFRKLIVLTRNSMIRAPAQFYDGEGDFIEAATLIKTVFAQAVNGKRMESISLPYDKDLKKGEQPYWKDVENLLLIAGMTRDFPLITELLRWIDEEQDRLDFVTDGEYKMQRLMCAARAGLEGLLTAHDSRCASQDNVQQAIKYARKWGWPEIDDVQDFLGQHRPWLNSMKLVLKHQ